LPSTASAHERSHATRILSSYQPGEKFTLRIIRQHKTLEVDATLPENMGRIHKTRWCATDRRTSAPKRHQGVDPLRTGCGRALRVTCARCAARIFPTICRGVDCPGALAERSRAACCARRASGSALGPCGAGSGPDFWQRGDLLVLNDTRRGRRAPRGVKPSGGRVRFSRARPRGVRGAGTARRQQAHSGGARGRDRGRTVRVLGARMSCGASRCRSGTGILRTLGRGAAALRTSEESIILTASLPEHLCARAGRSQLPRAAAFAPPRAGKRGVSRAQVTLHVGAGNLSSRCAPRASWRTAPACRAGPG